MSALLPLAQLAKAPPGLAERTEWFESLSYGLVLLEPYPLEGLSSAVAAYRESMALHVASLPKEPLRAGTLSPPWDALQKVVDSDHVWFETSFEQLEWFLGVVLGEDHGGHRQALGQYGRLVTEAVRRHLRDEQRLDEQFRSAAKR